MKNKGYAKLGGGGANKEHYGKCRGGELKLEIIVLRLPRKIRFSEAVFLTTLFPGVPFVMPSQSQTKSIAASRNEIITRL